MAGPGTSGGAEPSSLVQALRVLRERWWIVALAVALAVAASLALSLTAEKSYSASATILVGGTDLRVLVDPSAGDSSSDAERQQGTALLLVTSETVAERVKKALDLPDSPDSLLNQVSANSEQDAQLITITATDADPERAAALANAFAEQYAQYRKDADRGSVADGERLLRDQIAALPAEGADAQRQALQQALTKVTAVRALTRGDAQVVDRASAPGTPSSPRPKRDAILALLLGLVAGVGAAFLVDLFDRRIKNQETFEELYGLRALTSIPERPRDPSSQKDRAAALEPFRILRNALGFLGVDQEIRVVLVTSAVPGEGKSTVAAGLARATALAGQRVVLVEVDLRRPTFHQQFDLGGDARGLTTALVGGVPVHTLLRSVLPGLKTLTVLPSGPVPPNSAELLRSAEMSAVLEELKAEADVIVLDAPPLLPVADAQVLMDNPQVDAAIVVARAYRTTRDEVARTRNVLDRHQLVNLGLVVNGLRELDSGYEYYGTVDEQPRAGASRLTA